MATVSFSASTSGKEMQYPASDGYFTAPSTQKTSTLAIDFKILSIQTRVDINLDASFFIINTAFRLHRYLPEELPKTQMGTAEISIILKKGEELLENKLPSDLAKRIRHAIDMRWSKPTISSLCGANQSKN